MTGNHELDAARHGDDDLVGGDGHVGHRRAGARQQPGGGVEGGGSCAGGVDRRGAAACADDLDGLGAGAGGLVGGGGGEPLGDTMAGRVDEHPDTAKDEDTRTAR